MAGPLAGLRVIEFAGIGPGPFCGMLLADMGAEVLVIDRKLAHPDTAEIDMFNPGRAAVTRRGKRSVALDLKSPEGVAVALDLIERADVLIEGFRPGVMERLGLGPNLCLAKNPRLIYGRMTGWGQTGPLAQRAGHEIDYLAISGALFLGGHADEKPSAPPTLAGDMGGGAMLLAFGILCALYEREKSGQGQVIDAAITDGAALLMALIYALKGGGHWRNERGVNLVDGGAHFYDSYACADGKWLAVGPLEPRFYREFLARLGLDDPEFQDQYDAARWPRLKEKLAARFKTKSRDAWCEVFADSDACVAPVLDLEEAPRHPHNVARGSFTEIAGIIQPAPAPRFSRTPGEIQGPPPLPGEHTRTALAEWGIAPERIEALAACGAI
ncbi:MAG: CoA transferase [Rhodocyclaceae bacterium]|nr:CoA transferase [Rhodocyclaceae bacterium]